MLHIRIAQILLTLLCLLVVVPGCSPVKQPTLTPEVTSIREVTPRGISIRVTVGVFNPNSFDLSTQKIEATITIGHVKLGPIAQPHGVELKAGTSTSVTFDVIADWVQLADIAQLAALGPSVPYQVEGTVSIGGKRLNVALPFKLTGEIQQSHFISAGLRGLPRIPGMPTFR
ncbi:MAG: LEA type 2 family protein [Polyangiaceae bacterium]|nr:LEA type 2 family protein [Polyangiaceae bacterium]